jgi:hypothetical protein
MFTCCTSFFFVVTVGYLQRYLDIDRERMHHLCDKSTNIIIQLIYEDARDSYVFGIAKDFPRLSETQPRLAIKFIVTNKRLTQGILCKLTTIQMEHSICGMDMYIFKRNPMNF